jgi:hypothetical protein
MAARVRDSFGRQAMMSTLGVRMSAVERGRMQDRTSRLVVGGWRYTGGEGLAPVGELNPDLEGLPDRGAAPARTG